LSALRPAARGRRPRALDSLANSAFRIAPCPSGAIARVRTATGAWPLLLVPTGRTSKPFGPAQA